jgi:hypothetical protein
MTTQLCPTTGKACGGLHCEPPDWCERDGHHMAQWQARFLVRGALMPLDCPNGPHDYKLTAFADREHLLDDPLVVAAWVERDGVPVGSVRRVG